MKGKYLPIYMTFHQFYCDFFNWQNFVSSDRGVTGRDGARRGATGRNLAVAQIDTHFNDFIYDVIDNDHNGKILDKVLDPR